MMGGDKLRVYFTVDTETSLGGAWRDPSHSAVPLERTVFGEHKSRFYGIPLIMDVLERYNFRATFFTEVFCASLLGSSQLTRAFRMIRDRGHDAQLHLHPAFRFFRDFLDGKPRREIDLMWQLSAEEQCRLIAEGVALFQDLSGKSPRAYRAGCYGASETTLTALHANGLVIDSSYNLAYVGGTCGFQRQSQLNAPAFVDGILEVPVTAFRVPGVSGYKPLEVSAVSVEEILTSIRCLRRAGCRDAVLVLHSFSLVKSPGLRYERLTPDHTVIHRLRTLCAALKHLEDEIEIAVLGELEMASVRTAPSHVIPSVGWLRPALRKTVQGLNRLPWV